MTNPQEPTPNSALSLYESASCQYYTADRCRSCSLLGALPGERLKTKVAALHSALALHGVVPKRINPIVIPSNPWGSRHKVKMSVFGDCQEPGLGIIRSDQSAVDLIDCPLGTAQITELIHHLRAIIRDRSLTPYNLSTRQGELKQIVVMTTSDNSAGILRFILRSTECIPRIRKAIGELQKDLPWVRVISCNIQPIHAAIPEGEQEILLSDQGEIREQFGEIPLYLTPRSFMQVTPEVARQLYSNAAEIARKRMPEHILDLFCGVGGFALHVAKYAKRVTGVELSESAIRAASRSAKELNYQHVEFHSADSEDYLLRNPNIAPDMVVVNPPRRGLSPGIISELIRLKPESIIYSSCNPTSFARDVAALKDNYTVLELTPFDMFPLSEHCEVLCTLTSRP